MNWHLRPQREVLVDQPGMNFNLGALAINKDDLRDLNRLLLGLGMNYRVTWKVAGAVHGEGRVVKTVEEVFAVSAYEREWFSAEAEQTAPGGEEGAPIRFHFASTRRSTFHVVTDDETARKRYFEIANAFLQSCKPRYSATHLWTLFSQVAWLMTAVLVTILWLFTDTARVWALQICVTVLMFALGYSVQGRIQEHSLTEHALRREGYRLEPLGKAEMEERRFDNRQKWKFAFIGAAVTVPFGVVVAALIYYLQIRPTATGR